MGLCDRLGSKVTESGLNNVFEDWEMGPRADRGLITTNKNFDVDLDRIVLHQSITVNKKELDRGKKLDLS